VGPPRRRPWPILHAAGALALGAVLFGAGFAHSDEPSKQVTKPERAARPAVKKQRDAKPPGAIERSAPAAPEIAGCPVDEPAAAATARAPVEPPKLTPAKRVKACLIAPKDALARADKGRLLLVDVRPAAQFDQFRIRSSLNIPADFVKTKSFLKQQPFALVAEGRDSGSVEELCSRLKAAGFAHAGVLHGGLNGWRRAGGVVEGDLLAQRHLNRMSPVEFASERAYPDLLVIDLSEAPGNDAKTFFPGALSLPVGTPEDRLIAAVKTAVRKRTGKGAPLRLLVVDNDGSSYEKIESAVQEALPNETYFLEGGLAGYKKFWREQAAVWAATAQPRRRPGCGV
jgi:rhodanese-related sulfurtransferase